MSYVLTHSEQITSKYAIRNPVTVGFMSGLTETRCTVLAFMY